MSGGEERERERERGGEDIYRERGRVCGRWTPLSEEPYSLLGSENGDNGPSVGHPSDTSMKQGEREREREWERERERVCYTGCNRTWEPLLADSGKLKHPYHPCHRPSTSDLQRQFNWTTM